MTLKSIFTALLLMVCTVAAMAQSENKAKEELPKLSVAEGKGTYYVMPGRRTANGDRYEKNEYTCAHRSLPFGTRVKVTNQKNGKEVVVRVNDRGPFGKGFVIDLSYIAADAIGILRMGTVPVHLEVVPKDTPLGPVGQ